MEFTYPRRLGEIGIGAGIVAELAIEIGAIDQRQSEVGTELDGCGIILQREGVIAAPGVEVAAIVERHREARVEPDRLLQIGERLRLLAAFVRDEAAVEVGGGAVARWRGDSAGDSISAEKAARR